MKLYYCRGKQDDGEVLDGFVVAPDPKAAEDIYCAAWGGRSDLHGEFPEGLRIIELPSQVEGHAPDYLDWDKFPETVVQV